MALDWTNYIFPVFILCIIIRLCVGWYLEDQKSTIPQEYLDGTKVSKMAPAYPSKKLNEKFQKLKKL